MNKFLKALIISVALFCSHILLMYILVNFVNSESLAKSHFKGVLGAAIYILIMAFWIYYLLSLVYLMITKSRKKIVYKFSIAVLLMVIGYIMYRGGDIIDGDFVKRFQIGPLFSFLLSSIIIVFTDLLIERKGK